VRVAVAQVNNQVVTFAELFVEAARTRPDIDGPGDRNARDARRRHDIVVTDTACKP